MYTNIVGSAYRFRQGRGGVLLVRHGEEIFIGLSKFICLEGISPYFPHITRVYSPSLGSTTLVVG
ncbi:MAG: hypothetical protein WA667_16195 [Candidatus Nitrosopolaris sp.]